MRLFDELIDHRSQAILERECRAINWSRDVTERLGTRLYALWNRTAGDCLLDSVLQATWGVFDTKNMLRNALADSLRDAEHACVNFFFGPLPMHTHTHTRLHVRALSTRR